MNVINLARKISAYLKVSALVAATSTSTTSWADVLAPEEYVISYNLSVSRNDKTEGFPSGIKETVQQTSFTHSLTGLIGLGILPWQHHLYLSGALKSIERIGQQTGLEFSDITTIDTKIAIQSLLFDYQPQYAPYGFEISMRTGLNLPTTPEGYRIIDRTPNLEDAEAIETTFDKGTLGGIFGLNLSGYYRIFWTDLELSMKTDFDDQWQERSATLGLGLSLSQLLAVQSSFSMVSATEFGVDTNSAEVGLGVVYNLSHTWSAGAGGYQNYPDAGGTENSFYVSLRTQSL